MFTGIIEELGTVREVREGPPDLQRKTVLHDTNLGDCIAVNGVDLTCSHLEEDGFHVSVMPETYRRTNLGDLKPGDVVNLERSVTLAARLGGHLVRGVVEATGAVESLTPERAPSSRATTRRRRSSATPSSKARSRSTASASPSSTRPPIRFAVSLVQFTQEHTNLLPAPPGDRVNLESDIIARYVGQLDERSS